MGPIEFKPDLPETDARIARWWLAEETDRPVVSLSVTAGPSEPDLPDPPATLRERWMDADYRIEAALARMRTQPFLGDTLPAFESNLGPDLLATLFGAELEFADTTSWSTPVVHNPSGWEEFLTREPDFGNPYWRAVEAMLDLAIERGRGRFLVSCPNHHGNFDLLAALRGSEGLCMDMVDRPELLQRAGLHAAEAKRACCRRYWQKIESTGMGTTIWCWYRHPGPACVLQCDFWAMISPQMGRRMILPAVRHEMAPMERSIFHLDGPGAVQHLDTLLELPRLHAVQWVQGAGGGPGRQWLELYRRVREAGKSVQCFVDDPRDALAVLESIGPRGLWLVVGNPFDSPDSAEAFLRDTARTG